MLYRPIIAGLLFLSSSVALGRTVEAGDIYARIALGVHGHLADRLALRSPAGSFSVLAEYAFDNNWLLSGGIDHRLSGSPTLSAKLGARYRFTGFASAVSPHLGLHAFGGGAFSVLNANIPIAGAALSGGVDYFITARWILGMEFEAQVGAAPTDRPQAFGGASAAFVVTYRAYSPFGSKPAMPLD